MDDVTLRNIKAKLLWGKGSEWSVSLKPEECEIVLDALVNPEPTGTVDRRERTPPTLRGPVVFPRREEPWRPYDAPPMREPYFGDPGDEHHDR